jgi:DNA (cytosine-5)-methyltransferase 1
MTIHTCKKCGKYWKLKGDYTRHINRKISCDNKTIEEKIKDIVKDEVKNELAKLNNKDNTINAMMKCTICDGEFPEGKHHPIQCYSLDPDWDLWKMGIENQTVYTFVDLFCGMGAFHRAFKQNETNTVKYKCVMSCDIEETSQKLYYENYGIKPYGDINKVDFAKIDDFDILCAGFPCQPFSNAGSKKGFNDPTKGGLFKKIMDIVDIKKPSTLILENVKNIVTINNGKVFDTICTEIIKRGYTVSYEVLDSKYFGSPQSRQRLFLICSKANRYVFDFNKTPIVPVSTVLDATEQKFINYTDKYNLQPCAKSRGMMLYKLIHKVTKKGGRQGERVYSTNTCGPTICASSGGPGGKTGLYYIDKKVRRLNVVECLQMFGFPKDFKRTSVPSDEKMLFHLGNSIVVNVLTSIIKNLQI